MTDNADTVRVFATLPDEFWIVTGWDKNGWRKVAVDVADQRRIIDGILAMLHNDGAE